MRRQAMTERVNTVRVWALFKRYHPNFSGSAIQGHRVFSRLVDQGFSVTVLAAGQYDATSLRGQRTRRDGVEIRYLRTFRANKWSSVAGARKLRKIIPYIGSMLANLSLGILAAWTLWREGRPGEIVRVNSPSEFSFLPIWVARLKQMHPVLHMTLLNSDDLGFIKEHWNKLSGALKQESFRRAEVVTGASSAQIQSCLKSGLDPRKLIRIPNGVDLADFRPVSDGDRVRVRQKLGLKPDGFFIAFVGSAIARKGLDVLIRAFLQIRSKVIDAQLLVVGPYDSGDPAFKLANDLKRELEASNQSSHVHWVGRVANVRDYMLASDVFCLPTRREGFGIVIIEAMAAGLPVVVARLDGVTTDIVQSEREGILVTGHNPDDYASAVLRLHMDPPMAREMQRAARARAVSHFSLESAVEGYAQLYRKLAGVAHN